MTRFRVVSPCCPTYNHSISFPADLMKPTRSMSLSVASTTSRCGSGSSAIPFPYPAPIICSDLKHGAFQSLLRQPFDAVECAAIHSGATICLCGPGWYTLPGTDMAYLTRLLTLSTTGVPRSGLGTGYALSVHSLCVLRFSRRV